MNRFYISPKFLVAAALATAALGGTTVAQAARPEVFLSIGLNSGPAWVSPSRGYDWQPERVYAGPPIFVAPRPVFEPPRFGRYDARSEWQRDREWRHAEWRRHERHEEFHGRGHDRDDDHGRDRGHDRDDDHGRRGGHRD